MLFVKLTFENFILCFQIVATAKNPLALKINLSYCFVIVELVYYFFILQTVLLGIFYCRTAFRSFNHNIRTIFKHFTSKTNTFTKGNAFKHRIFKCVIADLVYPRSNNIVSLFEGTTPYKFCIIIFSCSVQNISTIKIRISFFNLDQFQIFKT